MNTRVWLVISLIIAILVAVFAFRNYQEVSVDLFFFEPTGPLALVILVTFAIGVGVGLLSTVPGKLRKRRELKNLRKQMSKKGSPSSGSSDSSTKPGGKTSS